MRDVAVSPTPLCGMATLRDRLLPALSRIGVIPSFDSIGTPRKLNGVDVLANDFLRPGGFFLAKPPRAQPTPPDLSRPVGTLRES